jgi:hypothetical protein
MTVRDENGFLPLPRGVKPHLMPRYSIPPGNVYIGYENVRGRWRCTVQYTGGTHRLGFQTARELWRPPFQVVPRDWLRDE